MKTSNENMNVARQHTSYTRRTSQTRTYPVLVQGIRPFENCWQNIRASDTQWVGKMRASARNQVLNLRTKVLINKLAPELAEIIIIKTVHTAKTSHDL